MLLLQVVQSYMYISIAERGENNRYVTEAMKGWLTSIRCSTNMVLYNIVDTFMYYVVIYTHMYLCAEVSALRCICVYLRIYNICIYTFTFIAEWSVVKDIGEAKLHPFLFFRFKRRTFFGTILLSLTWSQNESAKYMATIFTSESH